MSRWDVKKPEDQTREAMLIEGSSSWGTEHRGGAVVGGQGDEEGEGTARKGRGKTEEGGFHYAKARKEGAVHCARWC